MTTQGDDKTKQIIIRRAKELVFHIYTFADAMRDLSRLGMTFVDVGEAVWSELPTADAARVPRDQFADGFGELAEIVASTYIAIPGEAPDVRAKRITDVYASAMAQWGLGPRCSVASVPPVDQRQAPLMIRSLLAQAPVDPGQSPAVQCAVMLTGMPQALSGSLSETKDGGLRMLSPMGGGALVEQFFDYSDVVVVAVQRAVTIDGPRIISS